MWRIALFFVIGAVIGSAIVFGITGYMKSQELAGGVIDMPEDKKAETTGMSLGVPDIGGEFELVNQDGETVTQDHYKDHYKLVFFGFTYCPAVCPTELSRMAKVLEALGEEGAAKIQPIFISVDPERDTPEVIKEYVPQYHPRLVGLTGTSEQIQAAKDSFKVFATKVENEMMDGYMVDHSSYTYFMSPENTLIKLYSTKDTIDFIAEDIKPQLEVSANIEELKPAGGEETKAEPEETASDEPEPDAIGQEATPEEVPAE